MPTLNQIDELEIFVLMDNVSDPFSRSNEGTYWNESQYQSEIRKQKEFCGADCCRACNGLSLFIQFNVNQKTHAILFDTGPDAGLIVDNAKRLGLDLTDVEAIVLSHGHFDHYGGTISALKAINKTELPVYLHPDVFIPRAFGEEELTHITYNLTKNEIEQHGGKVIETTTPLSLFDNTLLLSGEVPRVTDYEKGMPDEFKLKGNEWQSSPDVIDEQCLIFSLKDKGMGIITGCGHTGIVNATKHASSLLNPDKIHLLMGGFHLADPFLADRINPTIEELETRDPNYLVTGHCTGRQTQAELSKTFGDKHIPYGVGARFKF